MLKTIHTLADTHERLLIGKVRIRVARKHQNPWSYNEASNQYLAEVLIALPRNQKDLMQAKKESNS